jgi:small subunit ribosomal protein S1
MVDTGVNTEKEMEREENTPEIEALEKAEKTVAPPKKEENAEMTMEAAMDSIKTIENGTIVTGCVVEVNEDELVVDVGYKSEGIIQKKDIPYNESYKPGDDIEVMVMSKEDKKGNLLLSRRRVRDKKAWDKILTAKENDSVIQGKVTKKVKGGLNVDICGLIAFVPGSQIDIKRESNFEKYLNNTYDFKIIEANRRRTNIILSRRRILEGVRTDALEKLYGDVKEGDLVKGTVRRITEFGAFVDLGGVDGLLHITDLSWAHVKKVTDVVNVEDEVEVKVLSIDQEKGKISLGLKQKAENPWLSALEKYPAGAVVEGTVRNIVNYGAFIELEPGLEGLVHHSDMSWTRRVSHPKEMVDTGDKVKVKVLEVDVDAKKISLGIKQLQPDPWDSVETRYQVDTVVRGKVTNIVTYGAFIELEPGLEGLVHVSDMSWTNRVKNPEDLVKSGDEIDVKILDIDVEKRKISFGIKQVSPDPWSLIAQSYDQGEIYTGKVTNVTNFGIFVELEEGVEGLVHVSDISWTQKINNPIGLYEVGSDVQVKVLDIKPEEKRISLGMKQVTPDPWSEVEKTFKVGETYTGVVKNLTNFGAFVELAEGLEGLVHISDMSWNQKIDHPNQITASGEKIRVKILEINPADKKISLGLKQLVRDPWNVFESTYHEGMVVEGEVLRITNFGAFVKIEEGIEGLVHISQLSEEHVDKVEDVVNIGDRIKVKIIEIKDDERKLRLSLRDAAEAVNKVEIQQHIEQSSEGDGSITLGDIMGNALKEKLFGTKAPAAKEEKATDLKVDVPEIKETSAVGAAISPDEVINEADKSADKAAEKTSDTSDEVINQSDQAADITADDITADDITAADIKSGSNSKKDE